MHLNDRIGSELEAHLQEHAVIVDALVDRLRQGRDADNVILEMSEPPVACMRRRRGDCRNQNAKLHAGDQEPRCWPVSPHATPPGAG